MNLTVKSAAKINLSLDIVGLREDGYHLLSTVMQTVSLYDYIGIDTSKKGITLSGNLPYIPYNEKNIAYKAAKLFFELIEEEAHVSIELTKHIPVCAGMGGGSSNAAAVLIGLNEAFGNPISKELLCEKSVALGADVPYFFYGGTKICEGIGEIIADTAKIPECYIVILKDKAGVSTPKAFGAFDANPIVSGYTEKTVKALEQGSLKKLCESLGNALYDYSADICPQITKNIASLKDCGAYSCMTGSGSAVFGIFENETEAKKCFEKHKGKHEKAVLCTPVEEHIIII